MDCFQNWPVNCKPLAAVTVVCENGFVRRRFAHGAGGVHDPLQRRSHVVYMDRRAVRERGDQTRVLRRRTQSIDASAWMRDVQVLDCGVVVQVVVIIFTFVFGIYTRQPFTVIKWSDITVVLSQKFNSQYYFAPMADCVLCKSLSFKRVILFLVAWSACDPVTMYMVRGN